MNPRWRITITEGPDAGRAFPLNDAGPLVVGRGAASDTQIQDPRMSRVHCEVRDGGDHVLLIDRGGSGGVLVNGEPVQRAALRAGTEFQIGGTRLRCDSGDPLEAPTVTPASSRTTTERRQPKEQTKVSRRPSELVGEVFHHYRLDEHVSSGRNSFIFKAHDTKYDRTVAVKLLKPQLTDDDLQRERFTRAMQAMLPVKHPHIVRLLKAGIRGPHCWAALEWIDGISVAEMIDQIGISGMLDWRDVWIVAVHISRALVEAQEQQVVHRNITPSNIVRRRQAKSYLLTDLVLARALEFTNAQQLTRPGDFVGELGYLAPERLTAPRQVDERSDQFALGATLYALLTGRPPYAAVSVADYLQKLSELPAEPTDVQLGVEPRFAGHVMKMIAVDPKRRFADAKQALEALEEIGEWNGLAADRDAWS